MILPTSVEPVNATLSMSGCSAIELPAPGPMPVMMLRTPSGTPASVINSPSRKGGQRSLLGRLQNHGVAASQRGSELPGRHQQREIPRDDLPANADRLTQRVVEERGVRRIGLAVNLGDPSAVVAEGFGGGRNVEAAEKVSGLPLSSVSSSASSSACASISSAILNR